MTHPSATALQESSFSATGAAMPAAEEEKDHEQDFDDCGGGRGGNRRRFRGSCARLR
jgi:hypothetical protein